MAVTKLAICNLALRAAASRGLINDLEERSREAEECNAWFDLALDTMLESGYWPTIRAEADLTLVQQKENVAKPYRYAVPNNLLRPWYLETFADFTYISDGVNFPAVLATTVPNATLIYAMRPTVLSVLTPSMQKALIHGLAAFIGPSLTGDRNREMQNYQLAQEALSNAEGIHTNFEPERENYVPEKFLARGGDTFREHHRFIYPLGLGFVGQGNAKIN